MNAKDHANARREELRRQRAEAAQATVALAGPAALSALLDDDDAAARKALNALDAAQLHELSMAAALLLDLIEERDDPS